MPYPKRHEGALDSYSKNVNQLLGICKKKPVPFTYQWSIILVNPYQNHDQVVFSTKISEALEHHFRKGVQTPIIQSFLHQGQKHTYSFSVKDMQAKCNINEETFGLRRTLFICGTPLDLPKYWDLSQSHMCQLFPVHSNSAEFKLVEASVLESIPHSKVRKVTRIQNLLLYQKYYNTLQRVGNETNLFHGTRQTPPSAIFLSQEGFDSRLSGNQNMWGSGLYFAEDASYVDKFAYQSPRNKKSKTLLLASVALGSCFDFGTKQEPTLTAPPLDVMKKKRHDSISGITQGSRIYTVFNSKQCLPRYVIEYEI